MKKPFFSSVTTTYEEDANRDAKVLVEVRGEGAKQLDRVDSGKDYCRRGRKCFIDTLRDSIKSEAL